MPYRRLLAVAAVALFAAVAHGQPPLPPPGPADAPAVEVGPAAEALSTDRQWFAVDLMAGSLTGMRGQVTLLQRDRSMVVAEAFYGHLAARFGDSESAGGGLRWLTRRDSLDGRSAFLFGPGCGVIQQFDAREALVLTPTVDVQYVRRIGVGADWQIGLQVGPGIRLTENRNVWWWRRSNSSVTPLISVFTGFRF